MSIPDECYSTDEEMYNHSGPCEAVEAIWDQHKPGDVVSIWKGTPRRYTASDFVRCDVDDLGDCAADNVGEHVGDWPESNKAISDDLEKRVKAAVDAWADANKMQPNFYGVEDIEELHVKLTDEDGGYEVVTVAPGDF